MKQMIANMKRMLSILLATAMIATMMPQMGMTALAEEQEEILQESSGQEAETSSEPAEAEGVPSKAPGDEGASEPLGTPEETATPEKSAIPEETVMPEKTAIPEETETPEATAVPEETAVPSETPETGIEEKELVTEMAAYYVGYEWDSGCSVELVGGVENGRTKGEDVQFKVYVKEGKELAEVGYYFQIKKGEDEYDSISGASLEIKESGAVYTLPFSEIPEGIWEVRVYARTCRDINFVGEHATITDSESGETITSIKKYAEYVSFKVTPDEGYHVTKVYAVNYDIDSQTELTPDENGIYSFLAVNNMTIYAVAEKAEITLAPVYYANGSKQPLLVQFKNLEKGIGYHVDFYVDGEQRGDTWGITGDENVYYVLVNTDIGSVAEGIHKVKVSLYTSDGTNTLLAEKEEDVSFETQESFGSCKVIPEDASRIGADVYSSKAITKMELLDKEGIVRGKNVYSIYSNKAYNDTRYQEYFEGSYYLELTYTDYYASIFFTNTPAPGNYDLKVYYDDGTSEIFEDIYSVTENTVISEVYCPDNSTNINDETVTIRLTGIGLDTDKVKPVLYDQNGNAVTGDAELLRKRTFDDEEDYTFQLTKRKDAALWEKSGNFTLRLELETEEGYTIEYVKGYSNKISIAVNELGVGMLYYNALKVPTPYSVYVDGYKEDWQISVRIFETGSYSDIWNEETQQYEETGILLGSAEPCFSDVTDNILTFDILTPEGRSFVPASITNYDVIIDVRDTYGNLSYKARYGSLMSFGTNRQFMSGISPNMSRIYEEGTKEITIDFQVNDDALLDGTSVWTAYLTRYPYSGESVEASEILGEKVLMKQDNFGLEGTWKSQDGLEAGSYYVLLFRDDVIAYTLSVSVIANNAFYFTGFYGGRMQGEAYLEIGAPTVIKDIVKKYGEHCTAQQVFQFCYDNLQVEAFAVENGEKIKGISIKKAEIYSGNYLRIYLNGISSGCKGAYFKVTDKEGNEPKASAQSEESYYRDQSGMDPEYGVYIGLESHVIWIGSYPSLTGFGALEISDEDFPLTLEFYPYGQREKAPVRSFTIKKEDIKNSVYYFTTEDLEGLDSEMPYMIYLLNKDKKELSCSSNYVKPYKATVAVTGIEADKTKVYLKVGDTDTINVKVKPANATNQGIRKSIENAGIVTVSEDGKITALKPGQTQITFAASSNTDKRVTCTVCVADISQKKLNLETGESAELKIDTGEASAWSVKWSSSDPTVATVDAGGKVTAMANGYAVITATANGVIFTCEVTVSTSLKGIAFNKEALDMEVGDVDQAAVNLIPANAQMDLRDEENVGIGLTDEKGAPSTIVSYEISEDGRVITFTAVDAGDAVLTVSAGNFEAKLPIHVKEPFAVPDLEGKYLTALTNTDKTLADIEDDLQSLFREIGGDNEDWKVSWKDRSISINKLKGMNEFAVVYSNADGTKKLETAIPVKIATITGINISADKTTLARYYFRQFYAFEDLDINGDGMLDEEERFASVLSSARLTGTPVFEGADLTEDDRQHLLDKTKWVYSIKQKKAYVDGTDHTSAVDLESGHTSPSYLMQLDTILKTEGEGSATVEMYLVSKEAAGDSVSGNHVSTKLASGNVTISVIKYASYPVRLELSGEGVEKGSDTDYCIKAGTESLYAEYGFSTSWLADREITLKSSNPKVLAIIKEEQGDEGAFAELKVLGSGYVELTAVDESRDISFENTKKTISIYIEESTFTIRENSLKINLAASDKSAYVHLDPSRNVAVDPESVAIKTDGDYLEIKAVPGEENLYRISVKEGASPDKNKKFKAEITLKDEQGDPLTAKGNLTITTESKVPSVKVKATAINTFYPHTAGEVSKGDGRLEITTAGTVTDVSVDLTGYEDLAYDKESGTLYIKKDSHLFDKVSKVTFKNIPVAVSLEGYEASVSQKITVTASNSAPALTYTGKLTVYEGNGMETACTAVTDKASKKILNLSEDVWTVADAEEGKAYEVEVDSNGRLLFVRNRDFVPDYKKGDKIKVKIQHEDWGRAVELTVTIKTEQKKSTKMKAVLSKSTLELNTNAKYMGVQQLETVLSIAGVSYDQYASLSVTPYDANSGEMMQYISFITDPADGSVKVRINNPEKVAANKKALSYQVTAGLKDGDGNVVTKVSAKLTVKMKEVKTEKMITVSAKGSIDILDRANSGLEITPKLSGITGTVTKVKLTGRDGHLFEGEVKDGKVIIHAKESVSYLTGYNYIVKPVYTINNDYMTVEMSPVSDIRFKVKQGSVKKPASPTITVSLKSDSVYPYTFMVTDKKGNELEIADISLSAPKGMEGVLRYDLQTGEYTLASDSSLRNRLKAGKSYSFTAQITLKNQAANGKPVSVKVKMIVK